MEVMLFLVIVALLAWMAFERINSKTTGKGRKERTRPTHLSGRRVRFDYVDAEGEKTTRTVSSIGIEESYKHIYMTCFCELRQEVRTFRVDRIIGGMIVDVDTGEMIRLSYQE